jgi:hypothetical protein
MGILGFTLPVGLLAFGLLHLAQPQIAKKLPARYQKFWLSLLKIQNGHFPVVPFSVFPVLASLFIGATTHLFFDSITHPDGWAVEHVALLRYHALSVHGHNLRVCDVLYDFFTFAGVTWLALAYLVLLEKTRTEAAPPPATDTASQGQSRASALTIEPYDRGEIDLATQIANWFCAIFLGLTMLIIAIAARGHDQWLALFSVGIACATLLGLFIVVTGKLWGNRS